MCWRLCAQQQCWNQGIWGWEPVPWHPAARGPRQVPPLLPDGRLLEHREAGCLLHDQDGRDPGRLGFPLQAERPLPQPEGRSPRILFHPSGGARAPPWGTEWASPRDGVRRWGACRALGVLHQAAAVPTNLGAQNSARRLLLLGSTWVCLARSACPEPQVRAERCHPPVFPSPDLRRAPLQPAPAGQRLHRGLRLETGHRHPAGDLLRALHPAEE